LRSDVLGFRSRVEEDRMTEMRADEATAVLEEVVSSYLAGYRGETVRALREI
jgi:hypothetical protein